jgi:hypothetical protein
MPSIICFRLSLACLAAAVVFLVQVCRVQVFPVFLQSQSAAPVDINITTALLAVELAVQISATVQPHCIMRSRHPDNVNLRLCVRLLMRACQCAAERHPAPSISTVVAGLCMSESLPFTSKWAKL